MTTRAEQLAHHEAEVRRLKAELDAERGPTDKPFDPVTEGTPELFSAQLYFSNEKDVIALIAARDAAMRAEGEEIGRRKGLEEAAEIADGTGYSRSVGEAIRRAAAETAKDGGDGPL